MCVAPADRSTGVAVQLPFASAATTDLTRLPDGDATSQVKQSPETCGKRPCAEGPSVVASTLRDTPFSSICFNSGPVTVIVTTMFPNGSRVSDCPRVIG